MDLLYSQADLEERRDQECLRDLRWNRYQFWVKSAVLLVDEHVTYRKLPPQTSLALPEQAIVQSDSGFRIEELAIENPQKH